MSRPEKPVIQLERVALREIRLRLVEPFQTSAGLTEERRILLLELSATDGVETWSECVAEALPTYSPDTVDTCWLALSQWIIPTVLGDSIASPGHAHLALGRSIRGHRMARAAVEMGMWSLAASQRGLSLAALLSGESAYARMLSAGPKPSVETGVAIGMQPSPEALADRVVAAVTRGYRRVRMKIAPERDVAFVRAARESVGESVSLAVDGNGGYSLENPAHVRALEELDTLGLTMIEQPLAHDDLLRHAELQQRLATPICLDESIDGDATAAVMLALGSARMVNIKPGRVGGYREAIAIHDRCAAAGMPVWCGGMLETGIGRAYNVALASLPNFTEPGDLSPSACYWERDIVTPPWTMDEHGSVHVPLQLAGLGVDVDVDLIDDLTVRRASFSAP